MGFVRQHSYTQQSASSTLFWKKKEHLIKFPKKEEYETIAQGFTDATGYYFPGVIDKCFWPHNFCLY